jgi:hypothetical protein
LSACAVVDLGLLKTEFTVALLTWAVCWGTQMLNNGFDGVEGIMIAGS